MSLKLKPSGNLLTGYEFAGTIEGPDLGCTSDEGKDIALELILNNKELKNHIR
jgi:hypothetical protein